jgi:dipeptidyl aminopeptidase/acylaminoacyl peptidase
MSNYSDFVPVQRFEPTVAMSPSGNHVAYSSNASGQFNLYVRPVDGGQARQLTSFTGRSVRQVAWCEGGAGLVFTADHAGDEQRQVYRVAADGSGLRQLTKNGQWTLAYQNAVSADGRYVLATANDRDPEVPDVLLGDLEAETWERYRTPPGAVAFPMGISPDQTMLLSGAVTSNTACQCLVALADDPTRQAVPVTNKLPGTYFYPGPWIADGRFYASATLDRDFRALVCCTPDGERMEVIDAPDWDVEDEMAGSADGRTVAWLVNRDGRAVLRAQRDGAALSVPELPAGVVSALSLSADGLRIALLLNAADRPGEIVTVDLTGGTVQYLTDTRPAAVQSEAAAVPEAVTFRSADGTAIPGLLYRPAGAGRHPVLMHIHGGPTMQARPAYDALIQCLLARGIGVVAPNVRGSSGYGQAWQERIYQDWGGIDLADFEAAARYLQSVDWVDPARMAVYGRSYGGFAALSCLSRLPDLWAAGVSVCGPSDLITLARACPPTWRPNIDRVLGNPDRDADRLRQRSPLTYASQIKAPLLIIQGRQDPRVPETTSAQIAAALRDNGTEVCYQVYDDEGHTFTNRDNELHAMSAAVNFLAEHLQPQRREMESLRLRSDAIRDRRRSDESNRVGLDPRTSAGGTPGRIGPEMISSGRKNASGYRSPPGP